MASPKGFRNRSFTQDEAAYLMDDILTPIPIYLRDLEK